MRVLHRYTNKEIKPYFVLLSKTACVCMYVDRRASETVLGVDNAKFGLCYMYVWMVRMPFKRARVP